ncbi:unnamed protein product [Prunus armeniaca]
MKNFESSSATNDELLTITDEERKGKVIANSLEMKGSKILLGNKTSCVVLVVRTVKINKHDSVVSLSDYGVLYSLVKLGMRNIFVPICERVLASPYLVRILVRTSTIGSLNYFLRQILGRNRKNATPTTLLIHLLK